MSIGWRWALRFIVSLFSRRKTSFWKMKKVVMIPAFLSWLFHANDEQVVSDHILRHDLSRSHYHSSQVATAGDSLARVFL